LADVTRILAEQDISIEAVIQKAPAEGQHYADVVMLLHPAKERAVNEAIARIETLDSIDGRVVRLRLESLNG